MYLQITTKCNMKCQHCCYSCTMWGKHGEYQTILEAIQFARGYTDSISIGGGEPTLHPRFFDILRECLESFDSVWMATNGSQTAVMRRLVNILNQEDFPECTCEADDPEFFEENGCLCYERGDYDSIYQEGKLSVALSQDPFHDPIDDWVAGYWVQRARRHEYNHFEIRDASAGLVGVAAQGRAKKTGVGWSKHCVCSTLILRPDGKIKLCGCSNSPIVGNVRTGLEEPWEKIIQEHPGYQETNCYQSVKRRR